MMPYPEEGFWAPLEVIGVDAMRCFIEDNCPGGSGSTCFMSPSNLSACIADINGNDKESEFGSSVICEEGSYGRLCDQCAPSYFYSDGIGCLPCSGGSSINSGVVVLILVLSLAAILTFVIKGGTIAGAVLCIYDNKGNAMKLTDTALWKVLTNMARFKILYATAQIVGSVSWATKVSSLFASCPIIYYCYSARFLRIFLMFASIYSPTT